MLRQQLVFTAPLDETARHPLSIVREVWDTEEGSQRPYWKYSLPDAVAVAAFTPDGKIIVVEEFQPGAGESYLHVIGETLEQNEHPLAAAQRGLREETGFEASSHKLLASLTENSGWSNRLIHFVLAENCLDMGRKTEEGIKVKLLTPDKFWSYLMGRLLTKKPGGAGSLKAATLAFHYLGILTVR